MAFDYAKAYQQFIDEELVAASATAWMIPEAGKVRFTGRPRCGDLHALDERAGQLRRHQERRQCLPQRHGLERLDNLHPCDGPRREVRARPHQSQRHQFPCHRGECDPRVRAKRAREGAGRLPHPEALCAGERRHRPQGNAHRVCGAHEEQHHREGLRPFADRARRRGGHGRLCGARFPQE